MIELNVQVYPGSEVGSGSASEENRGSGSAKSEADPHPWIVLNEQFSKQSYWKTPREIRTVKGDRE